MTAAPADDGAVQIIPGGPDGWGVELERLMPPGAICAVLRWAQPGVDSDDHLPPEAAAALCAGLLAAGDLAFRWHDGQPAPAGARHVYREPAASVGERLLTASRLFFPNNADTARFAVICTDAPIVARQMFAWNGWEFGQQVALAFEPGATAEAAAVQALARGLDWRRRNLPAGTRLLFGGGHDGAFALVAARDAATLRRFCDAVRAAQNVR